MSNATKRSYSIITNNTKLEFEKQSILIDIFIMMPTMILDKYAHQSSETCIFFPSLSKSLMAIITQCDNLYVQKLQHHLIWRIIGRSILSSAATASSKDQTNLFQNSFVLLSEAPVCSAIYKGVNCTA